MSKSDPSEFSRINLTDGPDEIALKIRRAKTDPEPLPTDAAGLAGRPEADNLVGIYAALARQSRERALAAVGGKQFSQFKQELTELAVSVLGPIGREMQRLVKDPAYIDGVLRKGGERACAISRPILREVYDRVGFVQP
jgi:tryptophanyl-tRNA synthetase